MQRHVQPPARPHRIRKLPRETMVSDLTSLLIRMLQPLITTYPLLLRLLHPTFGLSYLNPFLGSSRCNADRDHDTLAFLLPLCTIAAALTAMPCLSSSTAHEAIHESHARLRQKPRCDDRSILSLGYEYACRAAVVVYVFMGTHRGKKNRQRRLQSWYHASGAYGSWVGLACRSLGAVLCSLQRVGEAALLGGNRSCVIRSRDTCWRMLRRSMKDQQCDITFVDARQYRARPGVACLKPWTYDRSVADYAS